MNTPALRDTELTLEGRVATLRLDRDDVRNELTGTAIATEIVAVAEWVERNDEVSVLVLTGTGRSFSAGGNVHDMASRSGAFAGDAYEVSQRYRRGIQRMTLAVTGLGVPTIAAVNGAAIGAGFDLACMCDLRLAARGAKMGETFVGLGLIPGDGGAWLLRRLVGPQRAAELIFTGRVFDAEEALEIGAVLEVVEPDELAARTAELAAAIASRPPRALRAAKNLLRHAGETQLAPFLDLCASYQAISHGNEEHAGAVATMLDRAKRG